MSMADVEAMWLQAGGEIDEHRNEKEDEVKSPSFGRTNSGPDRRRHQDQRGDRRLQQERPEEIIPKTAAGNLAAQKRFVKQRFRLGVHETVEVGFRQQPSSFRQ